MTLLHPLFTIATLILIGFSALELSSNKKYKSLWIVVAFLIILIGFRNWVGADYGSYVNSYRYYGAFVDFGDILSNSYFVKSPKIDMEWLFVFIGKINFIFNQPFFLYTFILAVISIGTKFLSFNENSPYPALSMALYLYPSLFSADGGQMRQAVAMGIILFSFHYIKKRKLIPFLIMIYLARGFHNSAVIFLPAYWLILIPLDKKRIITLILICIALSPLQIYQNISLLDSFAPQEVINGFNAYGEIKDENYGTIKLLDLISLFYTYFIITYNDETCKKIPYYEYIRNISVIGVCLYFIFRASPIYSSRLTAIYIVFNTICLPCIVASIEKERLQKFLFSTLVGFIIFYHFTYVGFQAKRAHYTWETYHNYLLW